MGAVSPILQTLTLPQGSTQHAGDPRLDLLNRAGRFNRGDQAALAVVSDQRFGLLAIHLEAMADHLFIVVSAAAGEQTLSVDVNITWEIQ